ncbi:lytic transglycosylase domain-containing protein [Azospirillum sp. sgz301742]
MLIAAPVAAGTLTQQDLATYKQAFKAADGDRHEDALRIASAAKDRLPAKIIRWMKLQAPQGGSFQEVSAFLRENPDWPGQLALRRAAEGAMGDAALSPSETIAWFKQYPPLSNDGFMRYADTLLLNGERDKALGLIRQRWADTNFNNGEEQDFLFRYRDHLRRQDHIARVDRLLWDHQEGPAKRMLPLVDAGWDALIEARIGLYEENRNVDSAVAKVPESLRDDPGLLYERLRYRRKHNDDDGALEILRHQPAKLGRPALWWTERHILARRALERQDFKLAYSLAKGHGLTEGTSYAEAEFLSGFVALRFLDMPTEAFGHFQKLYRSVTAPISKARGAYWSGRASEALGRREDARDWYAKASPYGTTFYGQLAAHKLDSNAHVRLPSEPKVEQAEAAAFERREVVRAVRMLVEIEGREDERVSAFLRRISLQSKEPEDYALAARLARELHRPDLAVAAAKDAAQSEIYLVEAGYPVIHTDGNGTPEPALVHALIRQESTFNPNIISSAGARGLMQLMPSTAQLVANKLGIKKHQHGKLISDPQYNVRLGSAYIAEMIDRYSGSYVLAVASYNAGPGRVSQWLNSYGDPRGASVDVVDWVELIPIYETRNYVQRVMEAMLVYRARLHGGRAELNLERELRR